MSNDSGRTPSTFDRTHLRQQGVVVVSHDLALAMSMLGSLILIFFTSATFFDSLLDLFRETWRAAELVPRQSDVLQMSEVAIQPLARIVWQLTAFGIAICSFAICARFAQIGFLFFPETVAPNPSRVDPFAATQRMFSANNFIRSMLLLAKGVFVLVIAYVCLGKNFAEILGSSNLETEAWIGFAGQQLLEMIAPLLIGLAVVGIFDYAHQQLKFERRLQEAASEKRRAIKAVRQSPIG